MVWINNIHENRKGKEGMIGGGAICMCKECREKRRHKVMEMLCKRCKSNTFTINKRHDCGECEFNGWWGDREHGEWKYDASIENYYREQAAENGECAKGIRFNVGCWFLKCTACGEIFHLPNFEE